MDLLKKIFGNKPAGAAAIASEIEKSNAEIETAKARIESAKAALSDIATMTDSEHAAAEAEHGEAVRALARLEARVAGLTEAHAEAAKAEAEAALAARAKAVKRSIDIEVPKLLAEYDAAGGAVASILAKLRAIRVETDSVNEALRRAGVDMYIDSYHRRYRKHPDDIKHDRCEKRTYVLVPNRYGNLDEVAHEDGAPVPRYARGPYTKTVVVERGHARYGAGLDSLEDITLPPGRLGSKQHWPPEK